MPSNEAAPYSRITLLVIMAASVAGLLLCRHLVRLLIDARTARITYRAANNPYIDRRIAKARLAYGTPVLTPKGAGTRELMRALMKGESVGLMNDQKFNQGIAVPFFGYDETSRQSSFGDITAEAALASTGSEAAQTATGGKADGP